MGLLRKRTSKPNLKAAEARLPTPPPQLPPLPAHIRRSESKGSAAAPPPPPAPGAPRIDTRPLGPSNGGSKSAVGNRRRSRSLWGTSDARGSNYSYDTTGGLSTPRRGSIGDSPTAQPWRSREAWAALHSEPTGPSILNELTFPCAPGAQPGWRGRGGGGFFGGEAEEMSPRTPSRAESRTDSRMASRHEHIPPLPQSPLASKSPRRPAARLPVAAPAPRRNDASQDNSRSDRASTPTPDLAKSPSPSPETVPSVKSLVESDSAAAYAMAAGISHSSDAMTDPRISASEYGSSQNHAMSSSSHGYGGSPQHLAYATVPETSPGLTSSPSFSGGSPYLASPGPAPPLTPRNVAIRRMASNDSFSNGSHLGLNAQTAMPLVESRSTPWGAASRSTTPVLQRENSNGSTVASVKGHGNLSASVSSVNNGRSPMRLPPTSYAHSEDGHPRRDKVEHFIDHRTSLPESNPRGVVSSSKNPSPAPPPEVTERTESVIDFSRPPSQQLVAEPQSMNNGASGSHPANLSASIGSQKSPMRTFSASSQQSVGHSRSRIPIPSERDYPSRSVRDSADRPPSRSTSSNGHHSNSEHVPYTPAGIANAVNAWRAKNGGRQMSVEELGLRPNVAHSAQSHGSRSAASSSHGHGSSSGHPKIDKAEVAPGWPSREYAQDPFTAQEPHAWEAAYDASDYDDYRDDAPVKVSRGPMRLPSNDGHPPEVPVQMVAHGMDVMAAHQQMNARIQPGPATLPRQAQHYQQPQQQRKGSVGSQTMSPPLSQMGPQRLPLPPGASRVLSPPPADGRSPPQGYGFQQHQQPRPQAANGRMPPHLDHSGAPQPGQIFRLPQHPQSQQQLQQQPRPQHAQARPQPSQQRQHPHQAQQYQQQQQARPAQVHPQRLPPQNAARVQDPGYNKQLGGTHAYHSHPGHSHPQQQQYSQQQQQPRVMPGPQQPQAGFTHAHQHVSHHSGVSIANVPMQVPQVHKSPRIQQSVAQGGWI